MGNAPQIIVFLIVFNAPWSGGDRGRLPARSNLTRRTLEYANQPSERLPGDPR